MKWFNMLMAAVTIILVAGTTVGCNTFKGMGQDIEQGGENIQDASDNVKEEIREEKNK